MIPTNQVCILLPTCNRESLLRRALDSVKATAPKCPIVVATDPFDEPARARARKYANVTITVCAEDHQGCSAAWNTALAAAPDDALAFVSAADDLIFRPGWLKHSLQTLHEMGDSGLVGFEDERVRYKSENFWASTHYIMTRDFIIEHLGGVFAPPVYRGDYCDWEVCSIAKRAGKYRRCNLAHAKHDWHGGENGDDTYRRAFAHWQECEQTFIDRLRHGFPITWNPILKGLEKDAINS